jgi:predicted PurR-regulated permease PerM
LGGALLLVGALILWRLAGVLLLLFAAILLAAALDALAGGLRRIAPIPRQAAIGLSAVLVFGVLGGVIALFGWRIVAQYQEIFEKIRESIHELMTYARAHVWSQALLERANGAKISDATDTLAPLMGSIVGATARYLTYAAIIVVSGIFMALRPDRYRDGVLLVVFPPWREAVADFMKRSGVILKQWLVSRLIVMVAIGVLASIGLQSLGIAGALTLGLTGGLLTFIPFVGALMAAVPAVLVALTISPLSALLTALMFWGVHFIEGTFITPLVQDEEVDLPPVLTIFATLAFAMIFGASGVFLASPLVLLIIVAVNVFYLEGYLGEHPRPPAPHRHIWSLLKLRRAQAQ